MGSNKIILAIVIYVVTTAVFVVLTGNAIAKAKEEGALDELARAVEGFKSAVKSAAKEDWLKFCRLIRGR